MIYITLIRFTEWILEIPMSWYFLTCEYIWRYVNMCVCVYVCMLVYASLSLNTHTHTNSHTHTHTHTVYIYIYILCACMREFCVCVFMCVIWLCVRAHTHLNRIRTHYWSSPIQLMHTYIYVCMHIFVYSCMSLGVRKSGCLGPCGSRIIGSRHWK